MEVSKVEKRMSDATAILRDCIAPQLRPTIQPKGYEDNQLLGLCADSAAMSALTSMVDGCATRTRSCGCCGRKGRGVGLSSGMKSSPARAVELLVAEHTALPNDVAGSEPAAAVATLLFSPTWSVDVAARALILERARFCCPVCTIAGRPGLLFELSDAVNGGSAPASALEAVAAQFAKLNTRLQEEQSGKAGARCISLQEAATVAYSLQTMVASLSTIRLFVRGPHGNSKLEKLTMANTQSRLQEFMRQQQATKEESGRVGGGAKAPKKRLPSSGKPKAKTGAVVNITGSTKKKKRRKS